MGYLQSASQLAGGEGIALIGQSPAIRIRIAHQIHTHGSVIARGIKGEVMGGRKRLAGFIPRRIDIGGEDREYLIHRNARAILAVPAGDGVDRRIVADFKGKLLEREQMIAVIDQLPSSVFSQYPSGSCALSVMPKFSGIILPVTLTE